MLRDVFALLLLAAITLTAYAGGRPAYFSAGLFAVFASGFALRELNEQRRRRFLNQLKSQRKQLREGGTVIVDEQLVRYDTIFVTYHLSVGGLISSISVRSPYRLAARGDHAEAIWYTLGTLLAGWWSFPLGPLVTLGVLNLNIFRRDTISVGELLDARLLRRQNEVERRIALVEQAERARKVEVTASPRINTGDGSASQKLLPNQPGLVERADEFIRSLQTKLPRRRVAHFEASCK